MDLGQILGGGALPPPHAALAQSQDQSAQANMYQPQGAMQPQTGAWQEYQQGQVQYQQYQQLQYQSQPQPQYQTQSQTPNQAQTQTQTQNPAQVQAQPQQSQAGYYNQEYPGYSAAPANVSSGNISGANLPATNLSGSSLFAANGVATATAAPTIYDVGNDYILPVPFTATQREIIDSVVLGHSSEIGAFFEERYDTDDRLRRMVGELQKMFESLHFISVHPALFHEKIIDLDREDAPRIIGRLSGVFMSLRLIADRCSSIPIHIGVISRCGRTMDLIESCITDRHVNISRHAGVPLNRRRPPKEGAATFYLLPSQQHELESGVEVPFDFMIDVDETSGVNAHYTDSLRRQLRNPAERRAQSPLLRLLPLYSVPHAIKVGLTFSEVVASAVTFKDEAGFMPPEYEEAFRQKLTPLEPFFLRPDEGWPLPLVPALPPCDRKSVEEALMRQAAKSTLPDIKVGQPAKRRKGSEDVKTEFTGDLNSLPTDAQAYLKELDGLRAVAAERQAELERITSEMGDLVKQNKKLKRAAEVLTTRLERYSVDIDKRDTELQKLREERREIAHANTLPDEYLRPLYKQTVAKLGLSQQELAQSRRELASSKERFESLRQRFRNATDDAHTNQAELNKLESERDDLKRQLDERVEKFRAMQIKTELESRDAQIVELKREIENLRETAQALADGNRVRNRGRYAR